MAVQADPGVCRWSRASAGGGLSWGFLVANKGCAVTGYRILVNVLTHQLFTVAGYRL